MGRRRKADVSPASFASARSRARSGVRLGQQHVCEITTEALQSILGDIFQRSADIRFGKCGDETESSERRRAEPALCKVRVRRCD